MAKKQIPVVDPSEIWRIFACAEAYSETVHMFNHYIRQIPKNPQTGVIDLGLYRVLPGSVMDAFAAELYLKCLIHLCGGVAPGTHNWVLLVSLIPKKTQDRMKEHFEKYKNSGWGAAMQKARGSPFLDFDAYLPFGEIMFKDMRYPYEHKNPNAMIGGANVSLIRVSSRDAILDIKPDWGQPYILTPKESPPTVSTFQVQKTTELSS